MRVYIKISCLLACLVVLTACLTPVVPKPGDFAPVSISGATDVQLLIFPSDNSESITHSIAMARQRVLMTMYLLTDSDVMEALSSARLKGISVRVLLEPHPYGADSSTLQTYQALQQTGVSVKYANPQFRFTHQKSVVVDNTAIILTANLTKSGHAYNREFGVSTKDITDVTEIASIFEADWYRGTITATSPHLVWSPQNARTRLDALLNSTTRSLLVYAEEIQDDGQVEALIELAGEGKVVRLLTSPPQDIAVDTNAADLDKLQRAGIRVRYLAKPYIHAKAFIVDGTLAFVGSENISTTSLEFNRELGIIIADKTAIAQLVNTFDGDWNQAVDR